MRARRCLSDIVEVLAVAGPTGVDISSDSRASSLPIGYSSLPSAAEHLAAGLEPRNAKAFCRSTSRVRQIDGRSDGTVVAAAIYLADSCDHHSESLRLFAPPPAVREGPARQKSTLWTPYLHVPRS